MTAPPPGAPQPDGDVDLARSRLRGDRVATWLLLGLLFLLMLMLSFFPSMSLANWGCSQNPGTCNDAALFWSNVLGVPGLVVILLTSIVVSVVLITRKRRAFYVPLIGGVAMVGCFMAWLAVGRNIYL